MPVVHVVFLRCLRRAALLGVIGWGLVLPVWGQETDTSEVESAFGTGAGLEIILTNNGFGLGGYYSHRLSSTTSFLLEGSLGPGKDERELRFFSRFGGGFVPNKLNYLLMLPVQMGIQRRLFKDTIEDNFRPYFHLTAGPTLGWVYPYFDDENGNRRFDDDLERRYGVFSAFPRGSAHIGLGTTIAFGAYFGMGQRITQSVRFGYALTYFFDGINILEPDIKDAQQLFQTPVISISFGRLF